MSPISTSSTPNRPRLGYLLSHDINEAITFRQNLRYSWMHNEQRSFYGTGYASPADEAAGLMSRYGAGGASTINSFAVDNQLQGKFVTGILSHTTLFGIDYRNTSFRDAASGVQHRQDQRVCAGLHQHMDQ